MTEAEWLECDSPHVALQEILGQLSDSRKARLFAVALCRQSWQYFEPHRSIRECVEFAEGYADGVGAAKQLRTLRRAIHKEFRGRGGRGSFATAIRHVASAAAATCRPDDSIDVQWVLIMLGTAAGSRLDAASHARLHARIIRDIFGNPFRPVAFAPEWRTSTAVAIARGMYESRDFSAMPILADALQDAGCENADILNHCRDASLTHVRGCWVADLVLENR